MKYLSFSLLTLALFYTPASLTAIPIKNASAIHVVKVIKLSFLMIMDNGE